MKFADIFISLSLCNCFFNYFSFELISIRCIANSKSSIIIGYFAYYTFHKKAFGIFHLSYLIVNYNII